MRALNNQTPTEPRFSGDALPFVAYSDLEHQTWAEAYRQLKELRPTHTCSEYQQNVRKIEACGLITADRIPQLRDLSTYLQRERVQPAPRSPVCQPRLKTLGRTGFELRPCGGLLSARDFLASLAFRTFQVGASCAH